MRLMSEDSVHKDELDELFTVEYVNGLIGQDDQISHTKKTRSRQTPVMTLRAFVGPAHQKNYPSVRGQILHNSKMSELWLRLTADATVRATITADGEHVFAVYDSMAFFCGKSESYARTTWTRLISAKSTYKSELEGLVHSATFCSSVQNNRYYTPAMTLRDCSGS